MNNMQGAIWVSCFVLASSALLAAQAQNPASPDSGNALTANYPANRAGILIQGTQWTVVANQNPAKTKAAHSLAAGLSYGIVPAKVVAEYDGEHASTQVESLQPVICICHFNSIPGAPALVRLHPKKGARELDGGKMIVYPITGGSKIADASKTDLIPADVSQPEAMVWLVRPQSPLEPGEYALMLGTQNISIFPFTVLPPPASSTPTD